MLTTSLMVVYMRVSILKSESSVRATIIYLLFYNVSQVLNTPHHFYLDHQGIVQYHLLS